MTNGGKPQLEKPEDVYPWAIYHEAIVSEKWHNQDGRNERLDSKMVGLEKRVTAVEMRVAVFAAIFGCIGGLLGAGLPALISAIR